MNAPTLRCFQCEMGYYSSDGYSCQKILLANCDFAFNTENCLECSAGYFLFENMGLNQCRLIDLSSTCARGHFDLLTNDFHCVSCPSDNYVLTVQSQTNNPDFGYHGIDAQKSFFLSPNPSPVANCVSYNQTLQADLTDIFWRHIDREENMSKLDFSVNSHFPCLECAIGYYLVSESNSCVKRANGDKLCERFSSVSDKCEKCVEEAYIHRISGECSYSPNKEAFCDKVSEDGLCASCLSHRFPELVLIDEKGDEMFTSNKYTPGNYSICIVFVL